MGKLKKRKADEILPTRAEKTTRVQGRREQQKTHGGKERKSRRLKLPRREQEGVDDSRRLMGGVGMRRRQNLMSSCLAS